jgi:MFS family permease
MRRAEGSSRRASAAAAALPPRARALRRDLAAIMGDGVAFSLMVGVGETYLAAFALAVGLGEVAAGLLASVPILAGAVLQLVSPLAVRRLGSHRRWIVLCARLQALTFLPLIVAALTGEIPTSALFAVATLYWAFGMGTGPAWNTWVGTLVPRVVRTRYFASRTRWSQAALLAGLLAGGAILQVAGDLGRPLAGFAAIFALGGACRMASSLFIRRQGEPHPLPTPAEQAGALDVLQRNLRERGGKLLVYMLAVQTAVHVAAPFFTPYMLSELALPYTSYVALVATSFVAKILALPLLGRIARRHGARRLLVVGGAGIVPLAGLWVVARGFAPLLAVQVLAGTAWAAYELATVLLVFEAIPAHERTTLLTLFNLANAIAMVLGALVGGVLLDAFGRGQAAYFALFLISTAGRGLTLILLRGVPDVPLPETVPSLRLLAARPSAGSIERPVISTLDRTEEPTPEDQQSIGPG